MASALVVGCSGGEDAAVEPVEQTLPPTSALPPATCDLRALEVAPVPEGVELGVAPTLPPGVDTGYVGSGPGSGNPYLAPGARPVPGPDMPVTTLGAEPVTVAVAVPPNPDVGSPAVTPVGETTVPAPPTTLPPQASTTTSPDGGATTTSQLMELAADPGCVTIVGEP